MMYSAAHQHLDGRQPMMYGNNDVSAFNTAWPDSQQSSTALSDMIPRQNQCRNKPAASALCLSACRTGCGVVKVHIMAGGHDVEPSTAGDTAASRSQNAARRHLEAAPHIGVAATLTQTDISHTDTGCCQDWGLRGFDAEGGLMASPHSGP